MNKLIKKLTTWLLVFGMTFTPVLTSINAVAANAEEIADESSDDESAHAKRRSLVGHDIEDGIPEGFRHSFIISS